MRRLLVLVLSLSTVALACGAPAEPVAPAAPKAPDAPATPAASSAAKPSAAPTSDADCFASLSQKRPAGWTEVGKLVITVKDEMPTSYEVRDASGGKVDSGTMTVKSPRAANEILAQKACKVGGVIAVYEGKAEKDGSLTATIVKPPQEDEAGDLAALCKQPAELTADLDESQKRRAAVDLYEGRLTSRKWRGWLFDMNTKIRKSDDAGRPAIMKAKADELDAAAKAKDCWFSGALRKQKV